MPMHGTSAHKPGTCKQQKVKAAKQGATQPRENVNDKTRRPGRKAGQEKGPDIQHLGSQKQFEKTKNQALNHTRERVETASYTANPSQHPTVVMDDEIHEAVHSTTKTRKNADSI